MPLRRRRRAFWSLCSLIALLLITGYPHRGVAEPPPPPQQQPPARIAEGDVARAPAAHFWLNVHDPNRQALDQALHQALDALRDKLSGIALNHAEEAIRLAPEDPLPHFIAGAAALELKEYEAAVEHFETHRRLDPEADARRGVCFHLAIAKSHLERWRGTIDEYERCLEVKSERDPDRIIYYGNMAETYMALGELDEAIHAYREALKLDPTQLHSLLGIGVALARKGKDADARLFLRLGLLQDPSLEVMTGDGVFFIPEGDGDFHIGLMLEELGRVEEARFRYRRFLEGAAQSKYHEQTRRHLERLETLRSPMVASYPTPSMRVTTAVVDPGRKWLALGTGLGRISLLNLETNATTSLRVDERCPDPQMIGRDLSADYSQCPSILDMAFTPDGREVRALLETGELLRLDPRRGLRELRRDALGERAMALSDRRSLSLSLDAATAVIQQGDQFELWDVQRRTFKPTTLDPSRVQSPSLMAAISQSRSRLFISHSKQGSIHALDSGEAERTPFTARIIDAEVVEARGLIVAATAQGIVIFGADDGNARKLLLPPGGPGVQAVTVDASGRYITAVLGAAVQIWDLDAIERLSFPEKPRALP